jgi:hypothetical protein
MKLNAHNNPPKNKRAGKKERGKNRKYKRNKVECEAYRKYRAERNAERNAKREERRKAKKAQKKAHKAGMQETHTHGLTRLLRRAERRIQEQVRLASLGTTGADVRRQLIEQGVITPRNDRLYVDHAARAGMVH